MDLGLIDGCEAYGSVESQSGDYAGGVAGICSAAIENCWAKCALSGGRYVGGITGTGVTDSVTGSGSTVSGCVSLVSITGYSQYAGAISGSSAGAFADNLFVSDTLAGLDGASAAGQAEPVSYEALLENEALPDAFRTFTVQFVAGEEVLKTVEVNYGESLPDSVYPDIPAVDGQYGEWDVQTLENIQFDTTVTAQYHASIDALPSDAQRADGRPVFLAEGAYTSADRLQAQPQAITPAAFGEISASIPEAIRKYCESSGASPCRTTARTRTPSASARPMGSPASWISIWKTKTASGRRCPRPRSAAICPSRPPARPCSLRRCPRSPSGGCGSCWPGLRLCWCC